MWAVEFSCKYHNLVRAIPCRTKEEADRVYGLIKEKLGCDPYDLKQKKDTTTVDIVTEGGSIALEMTNIGTIWQVNLDDPITEEWNAALKKQRESIGINPK